MYELALFAGAGGGLLGGQLLGWTPVGAVEIEPYPRDILLARQRDGLLPPFPVWDDVRSFDGKPWRGVVDIITGGFPCQDISPAGYGAGLDGENSGLWREMLRIIREVRPSYTFLENSPRLIHRGLPTLLGDLADAGYDAAWCVLGAADLGAPHRRDRIWILGKAASDTDGERREEQRWTWPAETARAATRSYRWWSTEPAVGRVAPRMAHRVDRLKAIGNGQVPSVAATAFVKLYNLLQQ